MAAPDSDPSAELGAHRDAVYRYIVTIVRDAAQAEDLTQDVLLRAHRNLPSLRDRSRLAPWLYRIATNVCHDRFRQASKRNRPASLDRPGENASGPRLAEALPDDGPRLDRVMEQREMSECVWKYLSGLPDSYLAVILLHDMHDMTNPEIAAMLEESLATVKIRLHRARNRLRDALAQACSFSTDEYGVRICEPKPRADNE